MPSHPFTLHGHYIDLELLCKNHNQGLCSVVSEKALWQNSQTFIPTPELVPTYIKLSMDATLNGQELPFAIISKSTHNVVGSIKLQQLKSHSAEIGSTFIALDHQKTAVNSEAKLILMEHAFESLRLEHIDFIIHKENQNSQKAIERLGITHKTSLNRRSNMPQWESYDYFSYIVTLKEWSSIKKNLQNKLFPS